MFFRHFFKAQSRKETEGFGLVICLNCFAVQSNTAHSSSQLGMLYLAERALAPAVARALRRFQAPWLLCSQP